MSKKNNKIQRECCVMFGDSLIMMVKWLSIATSKMPPFVITFFIIVVMLQQSVSLEMHFTTKLQNPQSLIKQTIVKLARTL